MSSTSRHLAAISAVSLLLTSCAPVNKNSTYSEHEIGKNAVVMYGVVKSSRPVAITGDNSGAGMTVGAVGGGLAGSAIGKGNGSIAAIIAGAVIGGVAGAVTEQSLRDQQGVEYIIRMSETGDTRSIVQSIAKNEAPIPTGQCVMVQVSGSFQRVLVDQDPSDCPAPPKHKRQHTKTKIKGTVAETTVEHDD